MTIKKIFFTKTRGLVKSFILTEIKFSVLAGVSFKLSDQVKFSLQTDTRCL